MPHGGADHATPAETAESTRKAIKGVGKEAEGVVSQDTPYGCNAGCRPGWRKDQAEDVGKKMPEQCKRHGGV